MDSLSLFFCKSYWIHKLNFSLYFLFSIFTWIASFLYKMVNEKPMRDLKNNWTCCRCPFRFKKNSTLSRKKYQIRIRYIFGLIYASFFRCNDNIIENIGMVSGPEAVDQNQDPDPTYDKKNRSGPAAVYWHFLLLLNLLRTRFSIYSLQHFQSNKKKLSKGAKKLKVRQTQKLREQERESSER